MAVEPRWETSSWKSTRNLSVLLQVYHPRASVGSKNSKVEEVPWTLLFVSRKFTSCDRGMPISMLKPRWHDLFIIIKQFVTCEGRYKLVFLYHLCLLMNFMGYSLNMPFYFHRSLYKMSKRFKRKKADSSLFHHGLIKLIIVYHLSLHGDSWRDFITRNGFEDTDLSRLTSLW
jgi:hypothetical protein